MCGTHWTRYQSLMFMKDMAAPAVMRTSIAECSHMPCAVSLHHRRPYDTFQRLGRRTNSKDNIA